MRLLTNGKNKNIVLNKFMELDKAIEYNFSFNVIYSLYCNRFQSANLKNYKVHYFTGRYLKKYIKCIYVSRHSSNARKTQALKFKTQLTFAWRISYNDQYRVKVI